MTRPKAERVIALRPPMPSSMRATTYYCKEGHPADRCRNSPPGDLSAVELDREGVELLQRQSLEIFTLMVNDGREFADALSAILLSGINWGANLAKKIEEPRKKDYIL